jgi:hypothetical protein
MNTKQILVLLVILYILYVVLIKNKNVSGQEFFELNYKIGKIDVYYTGASYLSKVVVNDAISKKNIHTYSSGSSKNLNTTIKISGLSSSFTYPVSVISWGRNFSSSSNPTESRAVQLFNNTACRLEYDTSGTGMLTIKNATMTNLGCDSFAKLPANKETLVATIYLVLQ